MTDQSSVIAVYESVGRMEEAVAMLRQNGVPDESISVLARGLHGAETLHGFVAAGHLSLMGVTTPFTVLMIF